MTSVHQSLDQLPGACLGNNALRLLPCHWRLGRPHCTSPCGVTLWAANLRPASGPETQRKLSMTDTYPSEPAFQTLFEAAPGLYLVFLPDAPRYTIVAMSDVVDVDSATLGRVPETVLHEVRHGGREQLAIGGDFESIAHVEVETLMARLCLRRDHRRDLIEDLRDAYPLHDRAGVFAKAHFGQGAVDQAAHACQAAFERVTAPARAFRSSCARPPRCWSSSCARASACSC